MTVLKIDILKYLLIIYFIKFFTVRRNSPRLFPSQEAFFFSVFFGESNRLSLPSAQKNTVGLVHLHWTHVSPNVCKVLFNVCQKAGPHAETTLTHWPFPTTSRHLGGSHPCITVLLNQKAECTSCLRGRVGRKQRP